MSFKVGDRLLAVKSVNSSNAPNDGRFCISTGEIYTVVKLTDDGYGTSYYLDHCVRVNCYCLKSYWNDLDDHFKLVGEVQTTPEEYAKAHRMPDVDSVAEFFKVKP